MTRKAKDENIERLIVAYGNAMFNCGEYDNDDAAEWVEEFEELKKKAVKAKNGLLHYIETTRSINYENEQA